MSSEAALKAVVEFDKLPSTPEKEEIKRQFLSDDIGSYEFFCLANEYLSKVRGASSEQGKCADCNQTDKGQTGEYPCKECGLPQMHDQPAA